MFGGHLCTRYCCISLLLPVSNAECDALLYSDAKTDVKNDDGKVPLEVAELNEQEAAVKALKEGKTATATATPDKEAKKNVSEDSKQDVYL